MITTASLLALLLCLASWPVFARLRGVPRPQRNAPAPAARISVIIPARNEERNIGALLASLDAQSQPPHEIIVVDDQSEDRTAEVARRHQARVVPGRPLPAGWLGKPRACQQGAEAATGDWFLFLDADVTLAPDALERLAHLTTEKRTVHSVCAYHRVRRPYEQLSAFFNLIMAVGTGAFAWKGFRGRRIGLVGQSLLVRRDHYEEVGGHHPVRGEVLENLCLAKHFAQRGIARRCYLGRGVMEMRMFPGGLPDLIAGWSKGFTNGADQTPPTVLALVSLWLTGLIVAMLLTPALPFADAGGRGLILGAYSLGAIQCAWLFRQVGNFSLLSALFFPVGLLFYQTIFLRSVLRARRGGTIMWKGRDVSPTP